MQFTICQLRYIRFHVNDCHTQSGVRLISAENCRLLHRESDSIETPMKDTPIGMALGFYHLLVGGELTYGHDGSEMYCEKFFIALLGDMPTSSTRMVFFPKTKRAIFLTMNKGALPTRDLMLTK